MGKPKKVKQNKKLKKKKGDDSSDSSDSSDDEPVQVPVTSEKIETVAKVEPTLEELAKIVIPPATSQDIQNVEATIVQPTTTETQASNPLPTSSTTT